MSQECIISSTFAIALLLGVVIYYLFTPVAFRLANKISNNSINECANFKTPPSTAYDLGNPLLGVYLIGPIGALLWITVYWASYIVIWPFKKLWSKDAFDWLDGDNNS